MHILRNKGRKFLPVVVAATILLAFLPLPAVAQGYTEIIFEPTPVEVAPGGDFTVTLKINNVPQPGIAAYHFKITFTPGVIRFGENVGDHDWPDSNYGQPLAFNVNNTIGFVSFVDVFTGSPAPSGDITLVVLHGRAGPEMATTGLIFEKADIIDPDADPIPANLTNGKVDILAPTPTPTPGGGGGGGGGGRMTRLPQLDVDLWGEESSWDMNRDGVLQEDVDVTSTDGKVTIHIPEGTTVLDPDGEPLEQIGVTPVDPPPTPPEGCYIIGAFDFEPDGATFDPGIEMTVSYNPDALPEGLDEENLVIAFFDDDSQEWVFVTGVVGPDANTVTFSIDHFTVFALIAREEVAFTFSGLSISPSTVEPGESVTISAQIINSGGMEGNCTVALLIDGTLEGSGEVTLKAGAIDILTFTVTRDIAGTYAVQIGGLTDEFVVIAPFPWGLVGGIVGGVLGLLAVAAIIVYFALFRRRKSAA